jgi:molecular chaperone DnaJ
LKIPKGIYDGAVMKVSDAGNSGVGAPDGDLYIKIKVKRHKSFERVDSDIYSVLKVPYWLAALGGKVDTETIYGREVVKIPSGTQHGFKIKIKHKGAPSLSSDSIGMHIFNISIEIPKKLSSKERKALKEIESASLKDDK